MSNTLSSLGGLSAPTLPPMDKLGEPTAPDPKKDNKEVREKFDQFFGETFYGQMMKAMHKMTSKPAYFHGGRGEEVFQGQLDQVLSEKMTEATAGKLTGPMFDLFSLQRG